MSLEGKTFVIELGETLGTLPFSIRNKLVQDIQSLGGKISSVVVAEETFAVISRPCTAAEFDGDVNLHYAVRHNIAIVSQAYIAAAKDQQEKAVAAMLKNSNTKKQQQQQSASSSVAGVTVAPRVRLRCFAIPLPQDSVELRALVAAHMHDEKWTERAKKLGNLSSSGRIFSAAGSGSSSSGIPQFDDQNCAILDTVTHEHFLTLPESKHHKVFPEYDETKSERLPPPHASSDESSLFPPPFPSFPEYTVARVALFADNRGANIAQQIELHVATRRVRLSSFANSANFAGSIEDKAEEEANEQNLKHRNVEDANVTNNNSNASNANNASSSSSSKKVSINDKGPTFVYPYRIVKYVVESFNQKSPQAITQTQRCAASFALTSTSAELQYSMFYDEAVSELGASLERLLPYLPGLGSMGVSAQAEQRFLAANGGASNVPLPAKVEETVASLFADTWNLLRTRTKSTLLDEATNMSISLADIVKAEAALAQIAVIYQTELEEQAADNGTVAEAERLVKANPSLRSQVEALCQVFFGIVKSEKGKDDVIETVEDLQHWEDITRALKSLLNVGEASAGNLQSAAPRVQYGALGCRMSPLISLDPTNDAEARSVLRALSENKSLVNSSSTSLLDSSLGQVVNVFALERADETKVFERMSRKFGGNRLLLHGTNSGNITSILSCGLQVPKAARLRRDAGMLGRGIYFGDCAQTALRYVSRSSKANGAVFLLVAEVALGSTWVTDRHQLNFTQAPPGFNSVQGMRGSTFADNEYVVYNADQVRLRYLVEIVPSATLAATLKSIVPNAPPATSSTLAKKASDSASNIALTQGDLAATRNNETVDEDFKVPAVKEVKPGLQSNSGAIVPLQKTHVKGRVLDMIGEFTVLQEYFNGEAKPIEAKYVFPLQSGAAVCGFEAYINDKKVVGVVKEKEKARKEYQAAVARGDGAYLMDESEESPDVFTISVGNLPGRCRVVIKIVYIIELNVDPARDAIEIRIPSEVHPATKDTELRTVTQKNTVTRASTAACSNVVIDLGFDMPFEIVAVECTHPVRRKRTVCRASIVCDQVDFAKHGDFVAYVKMTVMKNPRIWVEQDPEKFTTSAMITFFPDIDSSLGFVEGAKSTAARREVLVLLDGSASMKNASALTDAKNAAILTLKKLPSTWNFNVAIFGSSVIYAFPKALSVSETPNLKKAVAWIQRTYAPCFGGTDLKSALRGLGELLDGDVSANRRQVDVLLFSDGHLPSEEAHTFRTVRDASGLRVFPFAVGSNSSATTLFSVARVGRGRSVVLSSSLKSAWPGHVARQLTRSAQLALTNIDVDWTTEPNKNLRRQINESVTQSPRLIPSVFTGENTILYGVVSHQARQCELIARHTGAGVERDQYGDWPEQRMIVTANTLSMISGRLIHRLAAKARIRDWTEGAISAPSEDNAGATSIVANEAAKAATKQSIIDLGCEFGLVTPFTSMVAIEERTEDEKKKASVDVCTTPPVDVLAGKIVVDPIAEVSFLDQEYRAAWDKVPSLEDAAKQKQAEDAKRKAQLFSAATPEELLAEEQELAAKTRWVYDDEKNALIISEGEIARLELVVAQQNARLVPAFAAPSLLSSPSIRSTPGSPSSTQQQQQVKRQQGVSITSPTVARSAEDEMSQKLLDDAFARLRASEPKLQALLPKKELPHNANFDKMNTDMPSGLGILYPLRAQRKEITAAERRQAQLQRSQQVHKLNQYREAVQKSYGESTVSLAKEMRSPAQTLDSYFAGSRAYDAVSGSTFVSSPSATTIISESLRGPSAPRTTTTATATTTTKPALSGYTAASGGGGGSKKRSAARGPSGAASAMFGGTRGGQDEGGAFGRGGRVGRSGGGSGGGGFGASASVFGSVAGKIAARRKAVTSSDESSSSEESAASEKSSASEHEHEAGEGEGSSWAGGDDDAGFALGMICNEAPPPTATCYEAEPQDEDENDFGNDLFGGDEPVSLAQVSYSKGASAPMMPFGFGSSAPTAAAAPMRSMAMVSSKKEYAKEMEQEISFGETLACMAMEEEEMPAPEAARSSVAFLAPSSYSDMDTNDKTIALSVSDELVSKDSKKKSKKKMAKMDEDMDMDMDMEESGPALSPPPPAPARARASCKDEFEPMREAEQKLAPMKVAEKELAAPVMKMQAEERKRESIAPLMKSLSRASAPPPQPSQSAASPKPVAMPMAMPMPMPMPCSAPPPPPPPPGGPMSHVSFGMPQMQQQLPQPSLPSLPQAFGGIPGASFNMPSSSAQPLGGRPAVSSSIPLFAAAPPPPPPPPAASVSASSSSRLSQTRPAGDTRLRDTRADEQSRPSALFMSNQRTERDYGNFEDRSVSTVSSSSLAPSSGKVARVQDQIAQVREAMASNIDSLLCRGEKIESLSEQSELLSESAAQFFKSAQKSKPSSGLSAFFGGKKKETASKDRAKASGIAIGGELADEEDVDIRGPVPDSGSLHTHISVSLRDDTACGSLLFDNAHNPRASLPIQLAWRGESLPLRRCVVLALPGEGTTRTSRDGCAIEKFAPSIQVFSHCNPTTSAPASIRAPNSAVLRDVRINCDHIPNAPAIRLVVEIARNGQVSISASGKILPMMQDPAYADVSSRFFLRPDDRVDEDADKENENATSGRKIPRTLFGIELISLPSTASDQWLRHFFPHASAFDIARCPLSGMATGSGYVSFLDDGTMPPSAITALFKTSESSAGPLERKGLFVEGVPRLIIDAVQLAISRGFPNALQRMHPCAGGAILRSYLIDFHSIIIREVEAASKEATSDNVSKFLTLRILGEKLGIVPPEASVLMILVVALESLERLAPHQAFVARCVFEQVMAVAPDADDKTVQILRHEDSRRRALTLLCKSSEFSDGVEVFVVAVREPVPLDDDERRLCDTEGDLGVNRNSILPSDVFDYDTYQRNNSVKILPLW